MDVLHNSYNGGYDNASYGSFVDYEEFCGACGLNATGDPAPAPAKEGIGPKKILIGCAIGLAAFYIITKMAK